MSSQAEPTTITHFSHPHPLQLTDHQAKQILASCSGCKLTATGLLYCCKTCNYFLHIKCSKMPQQITHPFHKDHVFSLLAKPLYPDGCFNCDACGKQGDGFSYHCKVCSFDLHILCAAMPLSFTHQSHDHQLNLTFSPPYPDKSFNCDVCNTSGSNHWLYRCHSCGFDVHLNCKNIPAAPMKQACQGQAAFWAAPFQAPMPQAAQMASRSAPQPQPQVFGTFGSQHPATGVPLPNFMPNMTQMNQGFQGPVMPLGPRQNSDHLLTLQRLQNLANSQQSFNQHYLQALLAGGGVGGGIGGLGGGGIGGIGGGGLGGGPAGGLGGLQHILHALSGTGGGGGLGGLGGGGHNILQSLISGGAGGGGGLDILQGLTGGGSGLDLFGGLGGLLGGFGS